MQSSKPGEGLQVAIMSNRNKDLDYLNLDFREFSLKQSIDGREVRCFSKDNHKHRYHSDQTHLNYISDISLNIQHNIYVLNQYSNHTYEHIISRIEGNTSCLTLLNERLEYLKHQLSVSIKVSNLEELHNSSSQLEKPLGTLIQTVSKISFDVKELSGHIDHLENRVISLEQISLPKISDKIEKLF